MSTINFLAFYSEAITLKDADNVPLPGSFEAWKTAVTGGEVLFNKVSDETGEYYVYRRSDGQKFKSLTSSGPYSYTDVDDTLQAVHLKEKLNAMNAGTQTGGANANEASTNIAVAVDAAALWSEDNTGPSDVHQRGYYKVHDDGSNTWIYILDEQDSTADPTKIYRLYTNEIDLNPIETAYQYLADAVSSGAINLWNIPRAFWQDVLGNQSQYKQIQRFMAFESDIITTDNAQIGFPDLSLMNEQEQTDFVNSLLDGPVAVREVTHEGLKYYLYQLSGVGYNVTSPFAGTKYMWQQLSDENGNQLATSVYERIHDDALNQKFTALHVAEKRDIFTVPVDPLTAVSMYGIVSDGAIAFSNKDSYYKVLNDKFYLLKAHDSSVANTDVIEVNFTNEDASSHYLNAHVSDKQIDLWNVPSALWSYDGAVGVEKYQMTARFLAFDSQAQTVALDGAVDFPVEESMSLDDRNAFLKEFLAGPVRVKTINDGTDDWYVYQLSHDATVDVNRTNPFKATKYKTLVTNGVYSFDVNERDGTAGAQDVDGRDFRAMHLLESGTAIFVDEKALAPNEIEYRSFVADGVDVDVGGWGDDAFYQLDGSDLYIIDAESNGASVTLLASQIRKVQCTDVDFTTTSDDYTYFQQAKAQDAFGGAIQNQLSLWNVPDALWSVQDNRFREISRFLAFESQALKVDNWGLVPDFPLFDANSDPTTLESFVDSLIKSQVLVKTINDGASDYYVYQLSRQDATLPFKSQQMYKRLVANSPFEFSLQLSPSSSQTFEARHVQEKTDALISTPVSSTSYDQVVYEAMNNWSGPDFYQVSYDTNKFYLLDATDSATVDLDVYEVSFPTTPTAADLVSSPYMSDYQYFQDVVDNDQISLWNYLESFWLYEGGVYKPDTKSVVAFLDQTLIDSIVAVPTAYPALSTDTSTWTESLRNMFLNGPVKFGKVGTDYVYQLSSNGTNPWTVPFQGGVYSSPIADGPISDLLLHAIHAEEMITGYPTSEQTSSTPTAYEDVVSDIREAWKIDPTNTVTALHDISAQYKVHDSYLYFFGETSADSTAAHFKIAQTTTDDAQATTLNYTQQSISSNQFLAWEVPLKDDGTSDYWKFENGVWTFHSALVDMNVDSGTVDVDATVTTTVQDPNSLSQQYADLVSEIETAVNQLDPSVFTNLGSLSDYNDLITKANDVSQTLAVLNDQTNSIGDLSEIGDVIGAISQQLSTLTVSLSESVTIDAESALNSIKTFLSHYDEMRQELEKFRIQITLTRTIIIPQSLLTAINLLTTATTNIDEVSWRFAYFSGAATESQVIAELELADNSTLVLSGERKEELDNAILALDQLDTMSDKIIEDVHNEYLDEMKLQTDAIKSTLSRWDSIRTAIAGKITLWDASTAVAQGNIDANVNNGDNVNEIGDPNLNNTVQQDVTVNDP